MEPFSAAFFSTLSGKLAGNVAASLTGPLKRQIAGTPAQQAVERCLRVALVALVAQATAAEPEQENLLHDIFDEFFHYPAVWVQIGRLLKDKPLDRDELREYFAEAGYDAATLPNLNFDAGLDAFEAAFVEVADGQPALQGIIQIGQLRRQTGIQGELLTEMQRLVAFLQQASTPLAVDGGSLRAPGGQTVYHIWGQGSIINIESTVSNSRQSTGVEPQADVPLDDTLRPYLETVARRSGRLPLGPLNPGGHDTAQLALLKVFINLDAGEKLIHENGLLRRYTSAVAHAHENQRLIVLGDPGSGKSTLFRYLSFCHASHRLGPDKGWLARLSWSEERITAPSSSNPGDVIDRYLELQRRRERDPDFERPVGSREQVDTESISLQWSKSAQVPLLIELRNFAQTDFDPLSAVALWDYACEQLKRDDLSEAIPALKKAAQRGEALFLFDGVDEVPPGKRADIWRAIAALAGGPYGGCRWIAACRVLSFAPGEAPEGVPVQTLSPLTEEQIDAFVTSWYGALEEAGEYFPPKSAESLMAAARRPRLRNVARNPMLLTIMALVQTWYGTLPNERAKLYQQCVETLLLRWQRHKEENERDLPDMLAELGTDRQRLERLLWEIAWQAHSQGFKQEEDGAAEDEEAAADIPESEVMAIACRALGSWTRAETFVEYTERRAHLLLGRGGISGRLFTFPHRTFQEYLAACHLAADRRPGLRAAELALQGDYWREVLNLAAGTLVFNQNNWEKALDAIAQLLPANVPGEEDTAGWRRVWLAGEMADVVGREAAEKDEIGRVLLPRLRDQLAALVRTGRLNSVQRAAAGVALGRLGDPRQDVTCDVPVIVLIPRGEFIMGSERRKGQPGYDELSQWDDESTKAGAPFRLNLPAYRIGKYPVTVAQYRRFVEAGGYDPQESAAFWPGDGLDWLRKSGQQAPYYWDDPTWNVDNHPVVGVTWYEAVAYCAWLSATTGRRFRLPDEAMWEKAARGTDGRRWPWGNEWDAPKLNSRDGGIGRTSAVGIFPTGRSPYEVFDCAGNVLEWCSGPGYSSGASYPFQPRPYTDKAYQEELTSSAGTRALRGGAWNNDDLFTRAAYRHFNNPHHRNYNVGFRVVEPLSNGDRKCGGRTRLLPRDERSTPRSPVSLRAGRAPARAC